MTSVQLWLVTAGVVLVSATVQSMTGFGFAVLAVPLLALFWRPVEAVGLSMILSTLCILLMWPGLRKAERLPVIWPLTIGALVGLPIGSWALQRLDLHMLRLVIGTVTLAAVAVFGFGVLRGGTPAGSKPRRVVSLVTGLFAGLLTGSLSMPGPPVVMLLTGAGAPKASYRATLTTFAVIIYPIGLAAMLVQGLIPSSVLLQGLLHAPVLMLGIWAGRRLHGVASERTFALSSLALLAFAGALCFVSR